MRPGQTRLAPREGQDDGWPASLPSEPVHAIAPPSLDMTSRPTFTKLSPRPAMSSLGATDAVCLSRSHQSSPGPMALRLVGPEEWGRKDGGALVTGTPPCP